MRTTFLRLLLALALTLGPAASAAPRPDTTDVRQATAQAGPLRPVPGEVTRPFQPPTHPYGPGHRGVDLAAAPGQPVQAAMAGRVRYSGEIAGVGWVTLDHGGGLTTTYGPLSDRADVGAEVHAGSAIGRLTEGFHLDWGARIDEGYIDPMTLLQRWRPALTRVDGAPVDAREHVSGTPWCGAGVAPGFDC